MLTAEEIKAEENRVVDVELLGIVDWLAYELRRQGVTSDVDRSRVLAIGCVKWLHRYMHQAGSGYEFLHGTAEVCKARLLRECERWKFADEWKLARLARFCDEPVPHYWHELELA